MKGVGGFEGYLCLDSGNTIVTLDAIETDTAAHTTERGFLCCVDGCFCMALAEQNRAALRRRFFVFVLVITNNVIDVG